MGNEYLHEHLPANKSGGEVTLSISESILLAIEAASKAKLAKQDMEPLYKLYIAGIKTQEQQLFVTQLKTVLLQKGYLVKADAQTTNDDSCRRYFETQLAYFLLQQNAETLPQHELITYKENLRKRLFALPTPNANRIKVETIFSGEFKSKILNKYEKEYAELILKLVNHNFHGLSPKACENCLHIACATSLATLNTQLDSSMPVDIYADSLFTMGMEGRGRITKAENNQVRTTAKGLMKSTTPLPLYADPSNAIEKSYQEKKHYSPFQRSTDQSDFMSENQWVNYLFAHQVHVYSNGISSTTLAQLRNMILEKRLGQPYFQESLQKFMITFASLMVYNSGGHSFFEIFEVLKLPVCHELIESEPAILAAVTEDKLMYQWLCVDQRLAFDAALQATTTYLQVRLAQKQMQAEFYQQYAHKLPESEPPMNLTSAVVHASKEAFFLLLQTTAKQEIDAPNANGWTALMIAAQLGRTEYVQKLINAGASIHTQVQTLSPLEIAVKCSHYEVVDQLLFAGAQVKRSVIPGVGIRNRIPALYFACRQSDIRILNVLLGQACVNSLDKKDALFCAINVENLNALWAIVLHINKHGLASLLFTEENKYKLCNAVVALGNLRLLQELIALNLYPCSSSLAHQQLLMVAVEKGFLPVVKWLFSFIQCLKASPEEVLIHPDALLTLALKNHRFNVAEFLLLSDASAQNIPDDAPYVKAFSSYLKEHHNGLLILENKSGVLSLHKKAESGQQQDSIVSMFKNEQLFFGGERPKQAEKSSNPNVGLLPSI